MKLTLTDKGAVYTADADLKDRKVTVTVRYGEMDVRVTMRYDKGDPWSPEHNIERFDGEHWVYYARKLPMRVEDIVYQIGYFYAALMRFQ